MKDAVWIDDGDDEETTETTQRRRQRPTEERPHADRVGGFYHNVYLLVFVDWDCVSGVCWHGP
eukprot:318332-Pyramimonas_sp.AAC.1